MERLGLAATARASFAFYNTREDVDRLAAGLHRLEAYLADLYQSEILEHDARPRNFRATGGVTPIARDLPLCGDHLVFYLRVEHGDVADASFQGIGCAIAKAAASLLTECVTGKPIADAAALCVAFRRLVTAHPDAPAEDLGPLLALKGVRQFPARAECACMAADAFLEVLAGLTSSSDRVAEGTRPE
jgi:nitrogen fixation NifU-like protein